MFVNDASKILFLTIDEYASTSILIHLCKEGIMISYIESNIHIQGIDMYRARHFEGILRQG